MAHAGRWRKPLAALPFVAATAAAALPTVVALSEDPQLTGRPGGFWADGADDGCGDGAACARDAGPWPLSCMVEDVMQQLAISEAEDRNGKALESAAEAEAAADTPGASTEAAVAALVLPSSRQAQHPASHRSNPASSGGPAVRLPRVTQEPSAASLAVQHSAEVAEMRQLALAELARLQATSAGLSPHSPPEHRRQQQQQQQQQQQPPGKQRWGRNNGRAAAAEDSGQASKAGAGISAAAPAPSAPAAAGVCPGAADLPPGFTDAELMRYAAMFGFLRAANPQQRQAALRDGAAAAARTVQWLQQYPFASQAELDTFSHLISWEGTDAAGHPVLRISIGKAVTECRGAAALAFANAIITHIETLAQRQNSSPPDGNSTLADSSTASCEVAAIAAAAADAGAGTSISSSGDSRATVECSTSGAAPSAAPPVSPAAASQPDQVVVLMDCTGASALNAARMSWVFQSVASTLSHHYPGRMRELVLLDLPGMLSWMVKPVQQLVHPDTRHKFKAMQREQYYQHRQQQQHHHHHHQHGHQHQQQQQQHGQQQHHHHHSHSHRHPAAAAGAAEQAQQATAPLQ